MCDHCNTEISWIIFFGWDLHHYHEESDQKARDNTSHLDEELGQVEYVSANEALIRLTENKMQFWECSINAIKYQKINGKACIQRPNNQLFRREVILVGYPILTTYPILYPVFLLELILQMNLNLNMTSSLKQSVPVMLYRLVMFRLMALVMVLGNPTLHPSCWNSMHHRQMSRL